VGDEVPERREGTSPGNKTGEKTGNKNQRQDWKQVFFFKRKGKENSGMGDLDVYLYTPNIRLQQDK